MNGLKLGRKFGKGTYSVFGILVQLLGLAAILLVCAFVFLRLYGMPEPILRAIVRQVNEAGFPVDVEDLTLTIRGWRATGVRYFSRNPDDLLPLLRVDEILLDRRIEVENDSQKGWLFDVQASGMEVNPSLDWGLRILEDGAVRFIDKLEGRIGFFPDRIEISDARLSWLDIDLSINGTLLQNAASAADLEHMQPRSGFLSSVKSAQLLERFLDTLSVEGDAAFDLDFECNPRALLNGRYQASGSMSDVAAMDLRMDRVELVGSYEASTLNVERILVEKDGEALLAKGSHHLGKNETLIQIENSIISNELLRLIPETILRHLRTFELQFGKTPRFNLQLGPTEPRELLEVVSGSFSTRDVSFSGLHIDSVRGSVVRSDGRLELKGLEVAVDGQDKTASVNGSGLAGGAASGSVFWDAHTHRFGVQASGSLDPNLLLGPLSMVRIATNVIARFRFPDRPPSITLDLGACYTNWSTFHLDIQGAGEDVGFHDALFSSVNAVGTYSNGVLLLDPVAGVADGGYGKATLSLDFFDSTATFDYIGGLKPELIEDAAYPQLDFFGRHVSTAGNIDIEARGILDWKTMQRTDFTATADVEHVLTRVAVMERFKADVAGNGQAIRLQDAIFQLYRGSGVAALDVMLDPRTNSVPYILDLDVEGADFRSCLVRLSPVLDRPISGKLSAKASIHADFGKDFFTSANGTGTVSVVEGQLADLPLFNAFSRLVRRISPGFSVFSITSLKGDFSINDGVVHSGNAYFSGDVLSAKGSGSYARRDGFDANVQVQMFGENRISKVIQTLTAPISKLFELHLGGSLSNPEWRLERFTSGTEEKPKDENTDSR